MLLVAVIMQIVSSKYNFYFWPAHKLKVYVVCVRHFCGALLTHSYHIVTSDGSQ